MTMQRHLGSGSSGDSILPINNNKDHHVDCTPGPPQRSRRSSSDGLGALSTASSSAAVAAATTALSHMNKACPSKALTSLSRGGSLGSGYRPTISATSSVAPSSASSTMRHASNAHELWGQTATPSSTPLLSPSELSGAADASSSGNNNNNSPLFTIAQFQQQMRQMRQLQQSQSQSQSHLQPKKRPRTMMINAAASAELSKGSSSSITTPSLGTANPFLGGGGVGVGVGTSTSPSPPTTSSSSSRAADQVGSNPFLAGVIAPSLMRSTSNPMSAPNAATLSGMNSNMLSSQNPNGANNIMNSSNNGGGNGNGNGSGNGNGNASKMMQIEQLLRRRQMQELQQLQQLKQHEEMQRLSQFQSRDAVLLMLQQQQQQQRLCLPLDHNVAVANHLHSLQRGAGIGGIGGIGGVGGALFCQPGPDASTISSPALSTLSASAQLSALHHWQEIMAVGMLRQRHYELEQQEHMAAMAFAARNHSLSLQQQQQLILKNAILDRVASADIRLPSITRHAIQQQQQQLEHQNHRRCSNSLYCAEEDLSLQKDICFGRGQRVQRREANISFRRIVATYQEMYDQAVSREDKKEVVKHVSEVFSKTGYRFFKESDESSPSGNGSKIWIAVSEFHVDYKIGHSFRSGRKILKQQQQQQQQSTNFA